MIKEYHVLTSDNLEPIDRVIIDNRYTTIRDLGSFKKWAFSGLVLVALANAHAEAKKDLKIIFEGKVR